MELCVCVFRLRSGDAAEIFLSLKEDNLISTILAQGARYLTMPGYHLIIKLYLVVLGPGVAANSISSARRRKQRRAVPELHTSSFSSSHLHPSQTCYSGRGSQTLYLGLKCTLGNPKAADFLVGANSLICPSCGNWRLLGLICRNSALGEIYDRKLLSRQSQLQVG